MFNLKSLAVAAALATGAAAAQAVVLILDDFDQPVPGQLAVDNSGLGVSVSHANPSALASNRTLTHTLISIIGQNPPLGGFPGSIAGAGGLPNSPAGKLNISNASQYDATVKVEWTLNSIIAGAPAAFSFDVETNDLGTGVGANTVEGFFNGVSMGSFNLPPAGNSFQFNLTAAQILALATAGQTFGMVFNGAPAWDVTIDNIVLNTPEPASLALAGLALIGAGVASRRRKVA